MSVVIIETNTADLAMELESSIGATEPTRRASSLF
jgi:hypothetical protein